MKEANWHYYFCTNYKFRWIPFYRSNKLLWKDKFNSPRCERCPTIQFQWLWFALYLEKGDDSYWEQWLWINEYCDGDIIKAEQTWGWVDFETKESTWKKY